MHILELLKNTFGFSHFRGQQEEIIKTVLSKNDALIIMPTGGGKSLCYQIPALVNEGLTLVISPLIALMNDQVTALKELNIPAATLHSHIDAFQTSQVYESLEKNALKLLYLSPEKIMSNGFLPYLKKLKIDLIAIDEAHCVSVWGNDFRPEYVKLSQLKEAFPNIPTIALTATADAATRKDIIEQLKLKDATLFLSSFERKNIKTTSKAGLKRAEQILYFLRDREDEAGIVYCLSRKSTESVAKRLQAKGYKAKAYHAGLDGKSRQKVQEDFQNDALQIVCATIAFGMGIDKPNIRWVIHYNMPKNIEGYYQEIGRAGRDGAPAEALLFYSWADQLNLQKFIDDSQAEDTFKKVQTAKLERMWAFANTLNCRTNLVLNYFGEYINEKCNHCDNCLNPPEIIDGTRYAQMALSAVLRTKEAVGINMLIDILRGSFKQEIRSKEYDKIKTFGVGREVPFVHWRHFITQLINQGIISIDFTDFSALKITPLSGVILKGEQSVQLAKFIEVDRKKKVAIPKIKHDVADIDSDLLSKLKTWRSALAKAQKVPVYIVLSNKALEQIAASKPDTNMKLLAVEGIGKVKLEKYGAQLLTLVQE